MLKHYGKALQQGLVWLLIGGLVGVVSGISSSLFLSALHWATQWRLQHSAIVWALPVMGGLVGWCFENVSQPIVEGNNLIIDAIHDNGPRLPVRLAPLVLLGSLFTHLFGGSAGCEGGAVQIGASLADDLAHAAPRGRAWRAHFLAAGVAGGFGGVFGTPVAGALFGLEFISLGRLEYAALLPAATAALVSHHTVQTFGVQHEAFVAAPQLEMSWLLLGKWLLLAAAAAALASSFVELTHRLQALSQRYLRRLPWRLSVGGLAIVLLWRALGTDAYLGLGHAGLHAAFLETPQAAGAAFWKLLLTAITVGSGFLGGEVTPLFFMGATLGHTLAPLLGVPIALAAGLTMVATFASAANTPLAMIMIAAELQGSAILPHACIVCVVAYLCSGHRGIYPAQRMWRDKTGQLLAQSSSLKAWQQHPLP